MNQILKDDIYSMGTQEQMDFMAFLGGMKKEEKEVFQLIHEGKKDLYIQKEMSLSKEAYKRIEESVRKKLLIAVFSCINYGMENLIK